jgi:hypothetical protein
MIRVLRQLTPNRPPSQPRGVFRHSCHPLAHCSGPAFSIRYVILDGTTARTAQLVTFGTGSSAWVRKSRGGVSARVPLRQPKRARLLSLSSAPVSTSHTRAESFIFHGFISVGNRHGLGCCFMGFSLALDSWVFPSRLPDLPPQRTTLKKLPRIGQIPRRPRCCTGAPLLSVLWPLIFYPNLPRNSGPASPHA